MSERCLLALKTIAFIIFSIALLITVIVFLGKERFIFKKTFELKARFKTVAGLTPQSPVYRYGLRVGSITDCHFLPDGRVEVVMTIEEKYRSQFHQGCYARIVPVGILGDKAVDIVGGEFDKPLLSPGSIIASEEPFDLNDLAVHLKPILKNVQVITQNLAKVSSSISRKYKVYERAVDNIATISNDIAAGRGTLGALIKKDEIYQDLKITMLQIRQAAFKINDMATTLNGCSHEAKPLMAKMQKAFDNLTELLANIKKVTRDLNKWESQVSEMINNLTYTSQRIRQASQDWPQITLNLKTASKDAVQIMEAAKRSWLIRKYLKLPQKKKHRKKQSLGPDLPWENTPKQWWE